MMKRAWFWLILILAGVILFVLAGCGSKDTGATQAPKLPEGSTAEPIKAVVGKTPPPVATQPPATLAHRTVPVSGGGTFNLKAPATGLETLASYSQHFSQIFDGQKDGAAFTSSMVITHTVQAEPQAELSALESSEQGNDPVQMMMLKLDGAGYFKDGEAACQGFDLASLQDPGAIPDPAELLPLVFGAQPAGDETVNGVAAQRFDFDQRALAQYQAANASGSVWTAKDSGWVVKYTLEVTAPKDVLGVGLEGKQTWVYEVTKAGASQDLSLPQDCTPVLMDFSVSPGAQDIERMSGSIVYSTSETLEAIIAFYNEKLAGEGWQAKELFPSDDAGMMLNFILPEGDKQKVAAIQLTPNGAQIDVTVAVFEEILPLIATPTTSP